MSYAGLGIAIPAYRGMMPRMTVARGWRGVGGLAASLPETSSGSSAQASLRTLANAAISAVSAASSTARRSPIAAVRSFQQAHGGLTVDGIYGPNTRSALATVTGRTDLPAVSSGGSSASSYAPAAPVDVAPAPEPSSAFDLTTLTSGTTTSSWMVPVAVVSAVVLVAGGLIYRQRRRVRPNRRR